MTGECVRVCVWEPLQADSEGFRAPPPPQALQPELGQRLVVVVKLRDHVTVEGE